MARVDFYILAETGVQPRLRFACRLAEKAYRLLHTVHIHTGSPAEAERIDELLWTFRDGSFVPHHVVGGGDEEQQSPVTIGCDRVPDDTRDLLINLSDEIPPFAEAFPRVAELVTSDDECRRAGRRRFAAYRDQGHSLETHNL